jgi:hypothetical protein
MSSAPANKSVFAPRPAVLFLKLAPTPAYNHVLASANDILT